MFKRLSKELYPLHLWNIYFHRCRGFCSLLLVKHLYFAFHICEIKLLLFLHLYTSAGCFCDHHGISLALTADYTAIGKLQYIAAENQLPVLDTEYTER